MPRTSRDGQVRHRADRPRGVEPLSVRLRPGAVRARSLAGGDRTDRHRRPGARCAPRPRTTPTSAWSSIPREYRAGARRVARPTAARYGHPQRRLARDRVRSHRGLRRGHREWFDGTAPTTAASRRRSTSPSSAPRSRATARTRTSGAPGTAGSEPQLVGRRRAALGAGAQLPQHLRRRRGVALRARPRRRAGRGDRQARQPVRRGGRPEAGRRLPAGVRVRQPLRVRWDRGRQPARRRRHRRAHGRRGPGGRRHRARLRGRGHRGAHRHAARTPAS